MKKKQPNNYIVILKQFIYYFCISGTNILINTKRMQKIFLSGNYEQHRDLNYYIMEHYDIRRPYAKCNLSPTIKDNKYYNYVIFVSIYPVCTLCALSVYSYETKTFNF